MTPTIIDKSSTVNHWKEVVLENTSTNYSDFSTSEVVNERKVSRRRVIKGKETPETGTREVSGTQDYKGHSVCVLKMGRS